MAAYKDAIFWVVANDDTEWLDDLIGGEYIMSVTACLVQDLFNKTREHVIADLIRERERRYNPKKLLCRRNRDEATETRFYAKIGECNARGKGRIGGENQ